MQLRPVGTITEQGFLTTCCAGKSLCRPETVWKPGEKKGNRDQNMITNLTGKKQKIIKRTFGKHADFILRLPCLGKKKGGVNSPSMWAIGEFFSAGTTSYKSTYSRSWVKSWCLGQSIGAQDTKETSGQMTEGLPHIFLRPSIRSPLSFLDLWFAPPPK